MVNRDCIPGLLCSGQPMYKVINHSTNAGVSMKSTLNYRSQTILLLLSLLALVWISMVLPGCKSSTEPDPTGIISGTINLVDDSKVSEGYRTDNSGVTVAIYKLAELDTTIVRINEEHPNIGVIISQETEFDHRSQSPLFATVTNSQGTFSIGSIPTGTYNVAILKDGWSVKYLYNVIISLGATSDVGEQLIKPSISLSGQILGNYTFRADRTYIINATASFISPVIMETGARIYVAVDESVKFYDSFNTLQSSSQDKYWKIDTLQRLYQINGATIDSTSYFGDAALYGVNSQFSSGLVRRTKNGVSINSMGCIISNVDLTNFSAGFSVTNTRGYFTNVNVRNGRMKGIQALSLEDSLQVELSIINNVTHGITPCVGGGFTIQDTYFCNNMIAVYAQTCSGLIEHCEFNGNNNFDINQYYASCTIRFNNFYYSPEVSLFPRRYAKVNNNNFYRSNGFFIFIRGDAPHNYTSVNADLDATDNYWGVNNIDDYILDSLDNASYPGAPCIRKVIYIPKKSSRVTNAGIRG